MAFPSVVTTATSTDNANDTTQTVTLPAGISSGDLLIILMVWNNSTATTTVPTGWTRLVADTALDASQGAIGGFYRQADGGEGASVDVTTSGNTRSGAASYRITGHENPATQAPEVSSITVATSTNPDPPSITPTGGSKDYLFLACMGQDGNPTPTGSPANYSNELAVNVFSGTVSLRSMERQLAASSEDPGNWTIAISNEWAAWTIAIHPPGGGIVNLDGTATAVSSLSGTLPVSKGLAATAAAVSSLTGALPVDKQLGAIVAASSSLAGALPVDKSLASTIPATSTLAGELPVERLMVGIVPAVSTLTGDLTVPGEIALGGVIPATSFLVGELPVERLMVSTVAAASTLDAILGKYRAINGSINAVSTLAGDLQRLRALAGAIAGGSTLVGALKLQWALRGVLAGISALPGSIKVEREIAALVAAFATLSGTLTVSAVGVAWTREQLLNAKDISGPALLAPHRKEIE